jgi:hypothetical protein
MKKLIFLLLFVIVTITASAQTQWFTTSYYSVTPYPNVSWSEWYPVEISVSMNATTHHIEIFSSTKQIIDYQTLEKRVFSNCDAYGAYATDSNYGLIYISIYFFHTGEMQMEIQYNDVAYKYQFKKE